MTAVIKPIRLARAPNMALAQLWCDALNRAGIQANLQRVMMSSITGEIPPDQSGPEVWITDATQSARANELLDELRNPTQRTWMCQQCHEWVEGGFASCWNCGADMPV